MSSSGQWFLQRKLSRRHPDRRDAHYSEAVFRVGKKVKKTITLGYLTQEEREAACARLRAWGPTLLTTVPIDSSPLIVPGLDGRPLRIDPGERGLLPGQPLFTRSELKQAALCDTSVAGVLDVLGRADLEEKMADGRYGDLTLREFVDEVYGPVRQAVQKAENWKRESYTWDVICRVLGHVRIKSLNRLRWDQYLASMSSRWSPRTKALAQQHYVRALRYAVDVGAIDDVHPVGKIPGANDTYTEPGESLTEAEVGALLAAASNTMHRTLFATAIGQGTRPSEVVKLTWDDVDWGRKLIRFAAFQGRRRVKGKNTQADKWVPITPLTWDHLRAYWVEKGRPDTGHVFLWRGKPFCSWRTAWKGSVARSGIDPDQSRKLVRYSVRYTYCSLGALAGIAPAAMRVGMRHRSTSRIMETTYERLHAEQVAEAFAAFPTVPVQEEG